LGLDDKKILELEGKIFRDNVNPEWNESIAFRSVDEGAGFKIGIDVRDKDIFGFDRLGTIGIKTEEIRAVKEGEKWFKLKSEENIGGEILLELQLSDQSEGIDLCDAVKNGNFEAVRKLVESDGKDVNAHSGGNLLTPLHIAVMKNNEQIAQYLLQHGADINRRNNDGNTALHFASSQWGPMVGLLLKNGADPRLKNIHGDEPQV